MADDKHMKRAVRKVQGATGERRSSAGYSSRVIVKFRDDVELTYSDQVEDLVDELRVGAWRQLQERFPGIRMRRLFTSIEPEKLKRIVDEAVRRDRTYSPPNFLTYFLVDCPAGIDRVELATQLKTWEGVQTTYVDPRRKPTGFIGDPDSGSQGYLFAADGIDAEFARGFLGGDGAGQEVIDLEQGWTLNHVELDALHPDILNRPPATMNELWRSHGTSVLGVICASSNGIGYEGIVPNLLRVNVVSEFGSNTPNAIAAAIASLPFGGVLLLESQIDAPMLEALPIEILQAEFDTIRLATAFGIIVIEAAGNRTTEINDTSGVRSGNLDTFVDDYNRQLLNRGIPGVSLPGPGFRDSGAIMVSAATSISPHKPITLEYTANGTTYIHRRHCFGSRIDCYSWGQHIHTIASSSDTDISGTTTTFGETSGAAAIVAGAALVVQGIAQARLGYRLSPPQMRALLSDPAINTSSDNPPSDKLGVMPNLRAIIESDLIAVAPDLYLRDFVGDTGDPHAGAISASPDLILLSVVESDPRTAFGEGSPLQDSNTIGSQIESGHDNYIYVRVRNRGGSDALNVTATVYWSPPATLVTPNLWNVVGQVVLPNVPAGNVLTVSDAVVWPSAQVPVTGHYCLVGLVGTAADPAPTPASFPTWSDYERFVRHNNNVTWRNFNVVDNEPNTSVDPSGFLELFFLAPGPPDEAREMRLEVMARLPQGARALLEMPVAMYNAMLDRPPVEINKERHTALVPLNPHGLRSLGNMLFMANLQTKLRLLVHIPEERKAQPYEVFVRHMYQDREVGRVTWRLTPRESAVGRRRALANPRS